MHYINGEDCPTCLVKVQECPLKYADVQVSSLYNTEKNASNASDRDYPGDLLNSVIDIVFSQDELKVAGGLGLRQKKSEERKTLDQHRVDAIRVYIAAKTKARGVNDMPSPIFKKKFTQKIGNARRREKRSCELTSFILKYM
ncbi:uncharacterized protein LOC144354699 [Saccoglossus kowalevskii]